MLGLELERSLPGGIQSRWQRDKMGRPLKHFIRGGGKEHRSKTYVWDVNNRLKSITDSQNGPITFQHDAFGNLAWAQDDVGLKVLRVPDAVGNLFKTPTRNDRKYGPAGQLLESRDIFGSTTYKYDLEGNLIEKVKSSGMGDAEVWRYHWNLNGMLESVERPDGAVVEFHMTP
jgi:YD repeat-containing protein